MAEMSSAPKCYRVRITSGTEKGRYVGARVRDAFVTDPSVQKDPVNVGGHCLWMQERSATKSSESEARAVQADLKFLGYESELVQVHEAH